VLIRAADICADDLQNHTVLDGLPLWILKLGIVDRLNLDLPGSEKNNAAIARHRHTPDLKRGGKFVRGMPNVPAFGAR
jgi:hypothetical protein